MGEGQDRFESADELERRFGHWREFLLPMLGHKPLTCWQLGLGDGAAAEWLLDVVLAKPGDMLIAVESLVAPQEFARQRLARHHERRIIVSERPMSALWLWWREVNFGDDIRLRWPDILHFNHDDEWECLSWFVVLWDKILPGSTVIIDNYRLRRRPSLKPIIDPVLQALNGKFTYLWQNQSLGIKKTAAVG